MKAVILVGGEGTRLRPLTCNIPKAMVPILNRPFLEHLVSYLEKHGMKDIILAMGCLPDPIRGYFGDGDGFGVRITYVVEEPPLGTAGAVKNAGAFLDEPFIVFNGDILTEIDLTAMMKHHREVKPKASIALTPVDNPTIYGVVETDAQGMVKRFVEKPNWDEVTSNMINAGIYILDPEVLAHVPASSYCMFENYLFPRLLDMDEPILSYPSDAYWIDIGTPEKYMQVNHDLLLKWKDRDVRTDGKSQIHPEARVEGPVLLAEGCTIGEGAKIIGPAVIGPGCKIAKKAVIDGAVLWHGSEIGREAVIRNCIVCSHCHVKEGSQVLDNCVLGDNVTVNTGEIITNGTRIWPEGCAEPDTT